MAYTAIKGQEFWYEFDAITIYDEDRFAPIMGAAGAGEIQTVFRAARDNDNYPAGFVAWVTARSGGWTQLSNLQVDVFTRHWGANWADIQAAFNDFAQGVLFDNRVMRRPNDMNHMMDGQTGQQMIGYHRWHASIRAIQVAVPAQRAWFDKLATCVGTAWAIQSVAKPTQRNGPNPGIPAATIAAAVAAWAPLTPNQLDSQYDKTPGVVGYHPDPLRPI